MGKLNVYYQDTIEDQPLDSSSVTVIEKTGSTSTKVTTDSGERGVKLSVPSSIRPRPVPVPVVAKELISDSLNTQSRQIISTYTFGKTGALQVGEYVNGTSGDLRITPDGITARNSSGTTTFSIDGTTGNATFLGTVAAGSVISTTISANNITGTIVDAQIATISWAKITDVAIENADIVNLSADKITSGSLDGIEMTIGNDNDVFKASSSGIHLGNASFASAPFRVDMDGNLVATSVTVTGAITTDTGSSLNLDYVTAGTLTAGTITGITITGGTIRTATSGSRVELSGSNNWAAVYNGSDRIIQMDSGGLWVRQDRVISFGGTSPSGKQFEIFYDSGGGYGGLNISPTGSADLVFGGDIRFLGSILTNINIGGYDINGIDEARGDDGYIDFNSGNGNTQTHHFDPSSSSNYNCGGSSRYWDYVNSDNFTEHSLGFYDEGVTDRKTGERISDLTAIKNLTPHPTLTNKYGRPYIDKRSLPKECIDEAQEHDGTLYERTKDDIPMVKQDDGTTKPDPRADGANLGAMIAILLGAVKELDNRLIQLESK